MKLRSTFRWKRSWIEARRRFDNAIHLTHQVCDASGVANGQRGLDVGCGFGGTLASLDGRFAEVGLHGLNIELRRKT